MCVVAFWNIAFMCGCWFQRSPFPIIPNGHNKPLITNEHTTNHVEGVRWWKDRRSSKGSLSPMWQLIDMIVVASPNCPVQMPNPVSKQHQRCLFFMSCGVGRVSCWLIVVAVPAKRGRAPRVWLNTYGALAAAPHMATKDTQWLYCPVHARIFTKNGESPSRESAVATPSPK